ncbi:MAG TPA: sulfatase [Chitinophagaceae bacterium]|nr:sulfatase [Chitinophagaceae bacterium]
MKRLLFLILSLWLYAEGAYSQNTTRPNVLFFIIDDLNDWISVLNKDNPIKMPNLERLAKEGVLFTHAYASSPSCNPSRASMLTGTRPNKTGVYSNASDWRNALPNAITIQRYFKDRGYFVCGSGKIFHHQFNWAFHDNASFDEYLMMSISEPYPDKKLNGYDWFGTQNTDWGVWPGDIKKTADYRTAEYAVEKLQQNFDQPFFLNVGIFKPHSPFFAPQEFFDKYPLSKLTMPKLYEGDTLDLPSGAKQLFSLTDKGYGSGRGFWKGLLRAKTENPEVYKEFVQAYQACATFADSMVGKVLDALDKSPYKNNTIIVLCADNGFHLGEKDHIEKFVLWEKATHVPFIIVAPGVTKSGMVITKPVDLTTIYPTLVDLCGFEVPKTLDGFSLTPLLKDTSVKIPPALMTYLKGNHAIRTERWRFIHYADGTEELYDHSTDENEWHNLAGNPRYQKIMDELRTYLPKQNAESVPDLKRPAGQVNAESKFN